MPRRRRRNPEDEIPYGEWIPTHAVRFNADGTVELMTEPASNPFMDWSSDPTMYAGPSARDTEREELEEHIKQEIRRRAAEWSRLSANQYMDELERLIWQMGEDLTPGQRDYLAQFGRTAIRSAATSNRGRRRYA